MKTHSRQSGGIRVVVALLAVLLVGITGALAYFVVATKPTNDAAEPAASTALKAGTIGKAPDAPQGWRKYTSKQFGISFDIPSYWLVKEPDVTGTSQDTANGSIYTLQVYNPNEPQGALTFTVSQGSVTDQVNQVVAGLNKLPGYNATAATLKWHDDDAMRITAPLKDAQGNSVTLTLFYVQVGAYVYEIPDSTQTVDVSSISQDNYNKFIESIQIAKT